MCGVIGIINSSLRDDNDLSKELAIALQSIQHRGQDAAGILTFDNIKEKFCLKKDIGKVAKIFNSDELSKLTGNIGIGHTRYETVGGDGIIDLQPMVTGFPFGAGMAHNGNLVNYHLLAIELRDKYSHRLLTNNDLEVLLNLWSHHLKEINDINNNKFSIDNLVLAMSKVFEEAVGGVALVSILPEIGLIAAKDPSGIRPLLLGKRTINNELDYCVASETVALNILGFEYVRDLEAGEILIITNEGELISNKYKIDTTTAPCMFEWVYFAAAESAISKKSVYEVRLNLGTLLAKKILDKYETLDFDFVCPVPDTGRTAAIIMSEVLNIPYREGLIKNRYISRSFILNTQEKRKNAVELKLRPVISQVKDKNILLVDDSIVRGTTSKHIIGLLKKYGAKSITMAITSPPLRYACYYGIDFPSESSLIAGKNSIDTITKSIGAKNLIYLDESDLNKAIGINDLCMACVNGKYPTSLCGANELKNNRLKSR